MFPQYILIFHSLIRFITVYLYCTWHDKLLIIRSNSPWVPSILLKEFFEQPRPKTFYIFIFYGLTMCCARKENITSITKTVNKLSHNKLRYIYFPSKEGKRVNWPWIKKMLSNNMIFQSFGWSAGWRKYGTCVLDVSNNILERCRYYYPSQYKFCVNNKICDN